MRWIKKCPLCLPGQKGHFAGSGRARASLRCFVGSTPFVKGFPPHLPRPLSLKPLSLVGQMTEPSGLKQWLHGSAFRLHTVSRFKRPNAKGGPGLRTIHLKYHLPQPAIADQRSMPPGRRHNAPRLPKNSLICVLTTEKKDFYSSSQESSSSTV